MVIAGAVLFVLGYVRAGRTHQSRDHRAGADHADADLRPRSHPEQRALLAFTADYRPSELAIRSARCNLGPVSCRATALPPWRWRCCYWLLYLVLRDSRIGRAIVAVRMDREAAALMGVDVKHINAITFAIGALMAGAAGRAAGIIFPDIAAQRHAVSRQGLRGLRARRARQRAGRDGRRLVLGVIEKLRRVLVGPEHGMTIVFLLLVLLFIVRPSGSWAGGATNEDIRVRPGRCSGVPCSRRCRWRQQLCPAARTTVCMYAVMAQSWNFIGGLAGYPSFATAAFFGLGAYAVGDPARSGAPMVLAWGVAGSRRCRSPRCSAARSCTCAGTISRSRA